MLIDIYLLDKLICLYSIKQVLTDISRIIVNNYYVLGIRIINLVFQLLVLDNIEYIGIFDEERQEANPAQTILPFIRAAQKTDQVWYIILRTLAYHLACSVPKWPTSSQRFDTA